MQNAKLSRIKPRSEAGVAFFFYFILIRKTYYH